MSQYSVNYYVALLSESVIMEAIGDTGHLSDLSTFYKSILAPMLNDPSVTSDQVYDIIVNEMMKYKDHGISPTNFNKFMKEIQNIKRSWDQDPQKHGMYKTPQEEMISYLGYWLTSGLVGSAKKFDRKPDITRREWANTPDSSGTAKGGPPATMPSKRRTFGEDVDRTMQALNEMEEMDQLTGGVGSAPIMQDEDIANTPEYQLLDMDPKRVNQFALANPDHGTEEACHKILKIAKYGPNYGHAQDSLRAIGKFWQVNGDDVLKYYDEMYGSEGNSDRGKVVQFLETSGQAFNITPPTAVQHSEDDMIGSFDEVSNAPPNEEAMQ